MITKVPMDMLFRKIRGTYGAALPKESKLLVHCIGPWMERISEIFQQSVVFKEERGRRVHSLLGYQLLFLKTIQVRRRYCYTAVW